mmetsp:Transcript_13061/g.39568  ORF Transcript_13061/g.39568 Transcript_13061/m.39568 type:complete len:207 (-) Transcript_13061:664-1284(-)|eukprot:CAMPEP_0206139464 /NCGR_PEP_ID=MMETSP1473-20131121/6231_1 /ASSEMBLY_ACC=CAM_ASM_001109 /TAXON_ID=1461547 /ORGANISM="Stichococcus sp, Strain RCC1054" /LENGTH=206 /DNA_ID=CAMNT_0053533275 /DNA_START=255 /DNA_END=875 /DNA_ORIENTATION=+
MSAVNLEQTAPRQRLGRPIEPQRAPHMVADADSAEESLFSCNICYEIAANPVVTLCGHLYCWPCIYRWMQVQNSCRVCPVCKAGIDDEKGCIPIYGRGGDNRDPRQQLDRAPEEAKDAPGGAPPPVPNRPAGQRPLPVQRNPAGGVLANLGVPQGFGIIPTLFGMQRTVGANGFAEPLTPEQQHEAFLSRLLLMLGSFVIMCLLLF